MAFSRITGATAGSPDNNAVTTGGVNTTGADLLIACVAQESAVATCVLSDSKGNTWNTLTSSTEGAVKCTLFWSRPSSVGSSHTFTATQTGASPSISVEAWSDSAASPFDQQNGNNTSAGTTIATGSVTPTENDELVVAGVAIRSGTINSIDSSFTQRGTTATGGTNDGVSIATLVQTSAAPVNPTWTVSASGGVKAARIATFKNVAPTSANTGSFFAMF